MDLESWMRKNGLTQAEMARKLDVFPNQVNNVLRGRHKPTIKFATKIKDLTNGEVTFDDIFTIKPTKTIKFKVNQFVITESDLHEFIKQKAKEAVEEVLQKHLSEKILENLVEIIDNPELIMPMSLKQTTLS